ncbi:MAG TPA: WbqC family protein, partial [Elusimicrobiota bacterium]|nr:WbqC family protein [Elusimicrobiota bacterium]
MIVALHQPHFCPWLGYFDRMRQADLFVLLDHVAHQPESYASRVRVKSGDASQWLSVPLEPSSRPEPIALKRLEAVAAGDPWPRRVLAALGAAYGAAPHFQETFEKLQGVLRAPEGRLVDLNRRLIELIKEALDIRTPIIHSSALGVGGEN